MDTTPVLPADLAAPSIINHLTHVGMRQLKRVDSVTLGVTADPRVLATLGIDPARPIALLEGDTCDLGGNPAGVLRGWKTYVNADAPLDVVVTR